LNPSPAILSIASSNPRQRYTQLQIYELLHRASEFYRTDRIRQIFMNSDIEHRHLYFDIETFDAEESCDQLNRRFRDGAMEIGAAAINSCLSAARLAETDIDYIIAVSCTGYLCPGLSSLLIKELGMRRDVQRADLLGMGCAGAMPGLQRAFDFVKAYPDKKALLLTVEICSACYYIDDSLETVVGNAICADGAAAFLLARGPSADRRYPETVDFETFLDPGQIDEVGLRHQDGKLRIILGASIHKIAGPMIEKALERLLHRHGLSRSDVHFWALHPGGRKVINDLRQYLDLTETQMRFSRHVLRNYGNMSSPTVMFVLDEVVRKGDPHPGDIGIMVGLGPGMAAELALLRW